MNDLQQLFRRSETQLVSPLEDFTTEALAIAIRHDPRPLVRALRDVTDWKPRSGQPSIGFTEVTNARAETQHYLYREGLPGGRLDLVVTLESATGMSETFWIEVKVDAPIGWNATGPTRIDQLDVYLKHREVTDPKPILLTLTKRHSLRLDITGLAWESLAGAVGTLPNADRSWTELVGFLRAESVVVPTLPAQLADYAPFLPVFREVNRTIKRLWPDEPKGLYWASGLDGAVRRAFENEHQLLLTAGPIRYGLRPVGNSLEWWVGVATGSDYWRVRVSVDEVIEAALMGNLSEAWMRSNDRDAVLYKTRPFVANSSTTDAADWLSGALQELHNSRVLDPYHQALRTKVDLEETRRASSAVAPSNELA